MDGCQADCGVQTALGQRGRETWLIGNMWCQAGISYRLCVSGSEMNVGELETGSLHTRCSVWVTLLGARVMSMLVLKTSFVSGWVGRRRVPCL